MSKLSKYKVGDVVWVKLERWALDMCIIQPADGIVRGRLKESGLSTIVFYIDESYGCKFPIIYHNILNLVDKCSKYEVDLL